MAASRTASLLCGRPDISPEPRSKCRVIECRRGQYRSSKVGNNKLEIAILSVQRRMCKTTRVVWRSKFAGLDLYSSAERRDAGSDKQKMQQEITMKRATRATRPFCFPSLR